MYFANITHVSVTRIMPDMFYDLNIINIMIAP